MMRSQTFGQMGIPSGHGSKLETWLLVRTKPPEEGRFSLPRTRNRYGPYRTGALSTATTL
jgi:hypothetical protein